MNSESTLDGLLTPDRAFETPFTIGVISDTHIYTGSRRSIHPAIIRLFVRAQIDLLIHLGDANSKSVLEELSDIAPLLAVPGNNDDWELQERLEEHLRFNVGKWTFGVLHGHMDRSARDAALRHFRGKVDLVMFGHSHKPLIETVDGTILFNPGSATDRRWFDHFGVGLIHVDDEKIEPELVLYTDPKHLDNVDVEPS